MKKALRFLNLLEPGKPVLSITKIAMWLATILTAVVVIVALWGYLNGLPPLDAGPLLSALGGQLSTSMLYAWRRFVAWKTDSPGLKPDPCDPVGPPRRFPGPPGRFDHGPVIGDQF